MYEALKKLQVNLKNYPWEHYPSYKIDKHEAMDLLQELEKLDRKEKWDIRRADQEITEHFNPGEID